MADSMDERELFARTYEGVAPEDLWTAVKRALATMDLKQADDGRREARFSTGISRMSWGQNMLASVTAGAAGESTLTVRGRPKVSLFSTKGGEEAHARAVGNQIAKGVDAALSNGRG